MVGPRRSSNIKAKTSVKKIEVTKKAPNPKAIKNKTSEIPVITTSSNLTSDYIGNITKTNKLNTQNEQKKYQKKKSYQEQIIRKLKKQPITKF